MSVLKLDNKSRLYICVPTEIEFVEDEVEIWLDATEEKICLFKDSFQHVLLTEAAWVVQHLETQAVSKNIFYPKLYVENCLGNSTDESYVDYLFSEYQYNTVWLTKNNNRDIVLEIWKIDAFSAPVLCERKFAFTISSDQFMNWWNQLVSKHPIH